MHTDRFDNQHITTFRKWIGEARNIVLVAHVNADGDACGSLLGMARMVALHASGEACVTPMLPNGCPKNFDWLPGGDTILSGDSQGDECRRRMAEADLLIGLDFNTLSRIGLLEKAFADAPGRKVLVDHHHNPDSDRFDVVFSDPDISSTCELVVWVCEALWPDMEWDRTTATSLYTGLRTDTGGFAFSCRQPSCYAAAARLVDTGIDPGEINDLINNNFSIGRMRFYGFALSERLRFFPEQEVAYLYFSLDDQRRFGVGGEEMEGLVNYTMMIKEVRVGALLREEEGGKTKVSLRAKPGGDVNRLAVQIGGGGHTLASGATYHGTFDEAVATVEKLLGIGNEESGLIK